MAVGGELSPLSCLFVVAQNGMRGEMSLCVELELPYYLFYLSVSVCLHVRLCADVRVRHFNLSDVTCLFSL